MRFMRLAVPALLLLALTVAAVAPPGPEARKPAPPPDDRLDYLFLASDRPVVMRVHLQLHDKPYEVAWNDFMDRLFDWSDKNKDGALQPAEAARIATAQLLQSLMQGNFGFFGKQSLPFASLDTNKDGVVSRAEFRAYYRKNGIGALRFNQNNFEAQNADRINKSFLTLLDTNGDGKLTQDEVARLPEFMAKLDDNEDELLTSFEISPPPAQGRFTGAVPPLRMKGPIVQETPFVELPFGGDRKQVASVVLKKYDGNKDGKLTREEIGLGEAEFLALDVNRDGALDESELLGFFGRAPDLVFKARTGSTSNDGILSGVSKLIGRPAIGFNRLETIAPPGVAMPLAKKMMRLNADQVRLELGDARVNVAVGATFGNFNRVRNIRSFYMERFESLADKKGYVDQKQEKENQMDPYLFQIFTQADKDADGKLTRAELKAWFDLLESGGNTFVNLSVGDQGRSVFRIIDGDGSGSLSMRELRTAWDRLKPFAKNGKEVVLADLPRLIEVNTSEGMFFQARFGAVAIPAMAGPGKAPTKVAAPAWFSKMDRNGDGDISPREWLGTDEEFREIDADGDGLISADEARNFEERRRREGKKR